MKPIHAYEEKDKGFAAWVFFVCFLAVIFIEVLAFILEIIQ